MGTKHSTSFSATTITVPFYLTHTPINRVLWVSPATAFCPGHGGRISNIESNRSEFICSLDWLLGMAKTDQPLNIWLLVFGAVMVFTALICLAFCALIWDKDDDAAMLRKKSTAGKLIQALLSVIGIALIGWFFVGRYWLWKTDDCEAQSEVTYRTVEAMLGMLCVTSGCIALCLCQACLVGRRGRVGAFQPLRDPEGDL